VSADDRTGRGSGGLIAIRRPTRREARNGAEIIFERLHEGRKEIIHAATCYESWQQWNAPRTVLSANVDVVEAWRHGRIAGMSPRRSKK
jgi:hypothetical protein